LALVFYKIDDIILLSFTLAALMATRFEGSLIVFIVAFSYLIAQRWTEGGVLIAAGLVVTIGLQRAYPSWRTFIIPNPVTKKDNGIESERFDKWYSFWTDIVRDIGFLRQIHAYHYVIFPCLLGAAALLFQAIPLAIFCTVYTFGFVCFIRCDDIRRFAIPVHVIAMLIGLDFFLSEKTVRFVIMCSMPVLWVFDCYYFGRQILSRQPGGPLEGALNRLIFYK
jgi:hypothetical protein